MDEATVLKLVAKLQLMGHSGPRIEDKTGVCPEDGDVPPLHKAWNDSAGPLASPTAFDEVQDQDLKTPIFQSKESLEEEIHRIEHILEVRGRYQKQTATIIESIEKTENSTKKIKVTNIQVKEELCILLSRPVSEKGLQACENSRNTLQMKIFFQKVSFGLEIFMNFLPPWEYMLGMFIFLFHKYF